MSDKNEEEKVTLPHHEQMSLCTTRLPYRQGRKLTAVKVYTINNESNHLLIFGVPSLNLRREAKTLFLEYGHLKQFSISKEHPAEPFTETYHAVYDRVQSARIAKKILDTKNFYGGSLHVCYAPELETIEETRMKLMQRRKEVAFRLRKLKDDVAVKPAEVVPVVDESPVVKPQTICMGDVNTISMDSKNIVCKRKSINRDVVIEKKFKPCYIEDKVLENYPGPARKELLTNSVDTTEVSVIDCTSAELETVTNINDTLNYNKFGNEIIRKIPEKPINRIKFNIENKKT